MYQKLLNYSRVALFTALIAGGTLAYAQSSFVPAPVQYLVSPETPSPNTQVTIEAQGVGTFLGDSTITWTKDGKVSLHGAGERVFTFTTGNIGTQTRIRVQILSKTQGTLTQDWVFIPSSITMLWEADTSVPPMYRGKAFYSGGSNVKVVALPTIVVNGKALSAGSFSYQWTLDDSPLPQQSGLGKNTLGFTGNQLQPQEVVEVAVYYGASKVGYGQVVLPATTPQILLYDKDPLRGLLLDTALPGAISMTAKEFTIQAVPYYFANSSLRSGAATYAWTLNGEDTTGPNASKGMLTLRQTGSGAGSATIGVTVQNSDSNMLVQAAQNAIQVLFGQSSSGSSFFGL
jgi:hypothetical protein